MNLSQKFKKDKCDQYEAIGQIVKVRLTLFRGSQDRGSILNKEIFYGNILCREYSI